MIELDFSTVKILAQRPTHISAVAAVLLITREREREIIYNYELNVRSTVKMFIRMVQ